MIAIKRILPALLVMISVNIANADTKITHFKDWIVVKDVNYCYAYAMPYRTRSFHDMRDDPYLLIAKKGDNQYSIGVSSGFLLSRKKGFTLKTNSRTHLLDVRYGENAITFSSIQDAAILGDMIYDNRIVEVRSYTLVKSEVAVDYYSLRGFIPAMQFLTQCKY